MSLSDGDNAIAGRYYPFQQYNRIKNHWRQSDPVANISNPQEGMIVSDDDDDKLYHCVTPWSGGDFDQILQENNSEDAAPLFAALTLSLITEVLEFVDAGTAAATEQSWIEVNVNGVQGYIRVFAAK